MRNALSLLALVVAVPAAAFAEPSPDWMTLAQDIQKKEAAATTAPAATPPAAEPPKWTKPVPLTFCLQYALASDYVFRGINYSKWPGQDRRAPSHQMTATVEYDTGSYGVFGGYVWFDWLGTQGNPNIDGNHTFEIDYVPYWRYNIAPIGTTVEIGYAFYTYPRFPSQFSYTSELYTKLTFDDSKLFGTKDPVLNPTVAYYQDMDLYRGGWLDVGISHKFLLNGFAATKDVFFLKDLYVTPSFDLGTDHRYLSPAVGKGSPSTQLAVLLYGLEVGYNLSGALNMPEKYGCITVAGFLNYSQSLERALIDDEWYSGLKLCYSW